MKNRKPIQLNPEESGRISETEQHGQEVDAKNDSKKRKAPEGEISTKLTQFQLFNFSSLNSPLPTLMTSQTSALSAIQTSEPKSKKLKTKQPEWEMNNFKKQKKQKKEKIPKFCEDWPTEEEAETALRTTNGTLFIKEKYNEKLNAVKGDREFYKDYGLVTIKREKHTNYHWIQINDLTKFLKWKPIPKNIVSPESPEDNRTPKQIKLINDEQTQETEKVDLSNVIDIPFGIKVDANEIMEGLGENFQIPEYLAPKK